jgi:hypothetical protein
MERRSESQGQRQQRKETNEMITEKMEGGILVRRYKGEKVDVESGSMVNRSITSHCCVNQVVSGSQTEQSKSEEKAP